MCISEGAKTFGRGKSTRKVFYASRHARKARAARHKGACDEEGHTPPIMDTGRMPSGRAKFWQSASICCANC